MLRASIGKIHRAIDVFVLAPGWNVRTVRTGRSATVKYARRFDGESMQLESSQATWAINCPSRGGVRWRGPPQGRDMALERKDGSLDSYRPKIRHRHYPWTVTLAN